VKDLLTLVLLLAALLAAASYGSNKSERAHRALDQQYQDCLNRHVSRTAFKACLAGHDR
jgi:hypothetical protein